MNIALIGNYGATNIGDDAILGSLLEQFSSHHFIVFSAHPERTEKQFKVNSAPLFPLGIRSLLKFRFRQSLKALKSLDAVILGGGGLFQDDKLYACFLWAWQVFWVKRLKKPLFICATGVGPLKTRTGRWLTRWAYKQAKVITVRDNASQELLKELGFSPEKIQVTADAAFLFESPEQVKRSEKKQLFISIRPWLNETSKVIESITEFLMNIKSQDWEFTFVAMQSIREEDQSLLRNLISKVGGKLFIPQDYWALLEKMSEADAAIGMRYHFLIAALLTNIPLIPISYSPKVSELVRGTPLDPYLISVKNVSPPQLQTAFEQLILNYEQVRGHQHHRLEELRHLAQKNKMHFEDFVKTIDPSKV